MLATLMQWAGLEDPSYLSSVGLRRSLHPLLDLARLHGEQLAEQLRRLQAHTASCKTVSPRAHGALRNVSVDMCWLKMQGQSRVASKCLTVSGAVLSSASK
jgi:hypothetical protein